MSSDQELLQVINSKFNYLPISQDGAKIINIQTGKVLNPSGDDTRIAIGINSKKVQLNMLAFMLYYQMQPPSDTIVLSRDLNVLNIDVRNLKLISKRDYVKIQRLIRNARKYLKLKDHPTDYYKVQVQYLEFNKGNLVTRTFDDSSSAKVFVRSKLKSLLKELEKLGVDVQYADLFVNKPRL